MKVERTLLRLRPSVFSPKLMALLGSLVIGSNKVRAGMGQDMADKLAARRGVASAYKGQRIPVPPGPKRALSYSPCRSPTILGAWLNGQRFGVFSSVWPMNHSHPEVLRYQFAQTDLSLKENMHLKCFTWKDKELNSKRCLPQWYHYYQPHDDLVEERFQDKGVSLEPLRPPCTVETKEDHPNKDKRRLFIQSLL